MVTVVASQKQGCRFDTQALRLFYVERACSSRVCVGSLRVLRLPPTVHRHAMHVRPTDNSKLSVGGSESERFAFLCGPVTLQRHVQGVTLPSL